MQRQLTAAAVIAIGVAGISFATAQTERPTLPLVSPPPYRDCQRQMVLAPGETTRSSNLSDELSRTKDVIYPPAGIDPGLPHVRWAAASPVTPPPGTPGGHPNIVPK